MKLYNFFQFLKDKDNREIPGVAKLRFDPTYEFNIDDFVPEKSWRRGYIGKYFYNDHLNLSNTRIKELPSELTVDGDLNLSFSQIEKLPTKLVVYGTLDLSNTKIKEIPSDLDVSSLILRDTPIKTLPAGLDSMDEVDLTDSDLEMLPKDLQVNYLTIEATPFAEKYSYDQIQKMLPGVYRIYV